MSENLARRGYDKVPGSITDAPEKVFISYASNSGRAALRLANKLREDGVSVWFDKWEVLPSHSIKERLRRGVKESFCCLVLLNAHFIDSQWGLAEVGAFWGSDKPILIYPIRPACAIPPFLADLRAANRYPELLAAIESLRGMRPDPLERPPWVSPLAAAGLRNAFRIPRDNQARLDSVLHLINEETRNGAQAKLRLAATSGFSYLGSMGSVWEGGLAKLIYEGRVNLEVVLESPFSPYAETRALANGITHHHWEDKIGPRTFAGLMRLKNVTLRCTEVPVECSLFLTSRAVCYDPYLWARPHDHGRTENNFFVFEFAKIEDAQLSCYALLERHYQFLLQNSCLMEDLLLDGEPRPPAPRKAAFLELSDRDHRLALDSYEARTRAFEARMKTRGRKRNE